MKEFGIRMGGNELELENLIKNYISTNKADNFKYLEIGAAGCVTFRAIYDIIKETIVDTDWKCIGIDIDGGWSIDWGQIKSKFNLGNELSLYINRTLNGINFDLNNAELWIDKNPRQLIEDNFRDIDICFIDACHGKCVVDDFLCVKNNIKIGGVIIFHDTGILEQGTDWQSHCNEFINVRKYLNDIGLFDNKINGWKFIKETEGTRHIGGDGNSCSVFQRYE